MSSGAPASCAHELRPGTVTCLHCRHAAHLVVAAKRRRVAGAVAAVVLAVSALVGGTVSLLRAPTATRSAAVPAARTELPATPPAAVEPVEMPPSADREDAPPESAMIAVPVRATFAARPVTPAVHPIVAEGRTPLADGMVAVRSGDTVAVHFDAPATRTRRHDKFERVLRATLPAVYGAAADAALAAIPVGQLGRTGDLLTELPVRGVRLRTANGATLAVWPQTRPGRDGPLVVTYLATVER